MMLMTILTVSVMIYRGEYKHYYFSIITIFHGLGFCMKLNEDGEYSQITVKIDDDVSDDNCEELLENLKMKPK